MHTLFENLPLIIFMDSSVPIFDAYYTLKACKYLCLKHYQDIYIYLLYPTPKVYCILKNEIINIIQFYSQALHATVIFPFITP